MKKVLQVVSGMNAGGMEALIMNYYRYIDKTKYQFDFMIMQEEKCFYEDEIKSLGGHIYRFPNATKHRIKNHIEVKKFLRNNKYDVIHCHQGITYYAPLKYAKKYGIKNRIIHNHGINKKFLKYLKLYNELWAKKRICSLSTNLISCSKMVLNDLFDKRYIAQKKYNILPNSIVVKNYKFDDKKRSKLRDELKISNDEIALIHVGTFTYPKNHEFLLKVFNELIKTNKKYKLILVGSGELQDNVRKFVNNNGLNDNVLFLGNRNDISDLLSAADIMLFPSRWEGVPLTLIEAQSNGIPILASNKISDEVVLTDNIKLLSIDDINLWLKEITNIKFMNKASRIKYNDIISKTDFNVEKSIKKLEKIYKN